MGVVQEKLELGDAILALRPLLAGAHGHQLPHILQANTHTHSLHYQHHSHQRVNGITSGASQPLKLTQ